MNDNATSPEAEERHTIQEWAALYGFEVLDPDGFDRKDPHLMSRLFTKKEWAAGWPHCTLRKLVGKAEHVGTPMWAAPEQQPPGGWHTPQPATSPEAQLGAEVLTRAGMRWTPEPWRVADQAEAFTDAQMGLYRWPMLAPPTAEEPTDEWTIFQRRSTVILMGNNQRPDDLRRAAVCVNALAGVADPAPELARLRAVEQAARGAADALAQSDALMGMVEKVVSILVTQGKMPPTAVAESPTWLTARAVNAATMLNLQAALDQKEGE